MDGKSKLCERRYDTKLGTLCVAIKGIPGDLYIADVDARAFHA